MQNTLPLPFLLFLRLALSRYCEASQVFSIERRHMVMPLSAYYSPRKYFLDEIILAIVSVTSRAAATASWCMVKEMPSLFSSFFSFREDGHATMPLPLFSHDY